MGLPHRVTLVPRMAHHRHQATRLSMGLQRRSLIPQHRLAILPRLHRTEHRHLPSIHLCRQHNQVDIAVAPQHTQPNSLIAPPSSLAIRVRPTLSSPQLLTHRSGCLSLVPL